MDKTFESDFSGRDVVVVFARAPVPGLVKTRLAKTMGNEKAAKLYAAMLRDCVDLAQSVSLLSGVLQPGVLPTCAAFCFAPREGFSPGAHSLLEFWSGAHFPQCDGDLGARLLDCFARLHVAGARKIIVIGSDAPDLPPQYLRAALDALEYHDLVFGPTRDGGFYLMGAACPVGAALFSGVRWSSARVMETVLENAARQKLHVAALPLWRDVDEAEDLQSLAARLEAGESHAPRTREWILENRL